ncbi:Glyoxalase domain-containing protein 4 [Symbiodinium microadriaticum]|uniref:Glyoxalase domain-containing protein 4 n=1 Tax=Symbiodinium microadriaticum TaxID=2951 RepID=A0A1Q9ET19_SYMMI|nr:Glyoxalase domain-containing protein 4 [Symbiodinium microadriaticum]
MIWNVTSTVNTWLTLVDDGLRGINLADIARRQTGTSVPAVAEGPVETDDEEEEDEDVSLGSESSEEGLSASDEEVAQVGLVARPPTTTTTIPTMATMPTANNQQPATTTTTTTTTTTATATATATATTTATTNTNTNTTNTTNTTNNNNKSSYSYSYNCHDHYQYDHDQYDHDHHDDYNCSPDHFKCKTEAEPGDLQHPELTAWPAAAAGDGVELTSRSTAEGPEAAIANELVKPEDTIGRIKQQVGAAWEAVYLPERLYEALDHGKLLSCRAPFGLEDFYPRPAEPLGAMAFVSLVQPEPRIPQQIAAQARSARPTNVPAERAKSHLPCESATALVGMGALAAARKSRRCKVARGSVAAARPTVDDWMVKPLESQDLIAQSRPAHWVLRTTDVKANLRFFTKIFGMKVLRHEEFEKPCAITCNGEFETPWSKTMIGYGPEDEGYCLELTYNYGVSDYEPGTGLAHIAVAVADPEVFAQSLKAPFI